METQLSRTVVWASSPPRIMQASKRLLALQGEIASQLTRHISYDLSYERV